MNSKFEVKGSGSTLSSYIRDFGGTEEFTDACMVHRNLCMGTSVRFTSNKPINFEQVETAVRQLQDGHLQLQTCLKRINQVQENGKWNLFGPKTKLIPKPQFHKIATKVRLEWITISNPKHGSVIKCLENLIQSTFAEDELLWRPYFITIRKGDADSKFESSKKLDVYEGIFTIVSHPALNDTTRAINLLHEFMQHFAIVIGNTSVYTNKVNRIHPTLEESIDTESYGNYSWSDAFGFGTHIASCLWSRSRGEYTRRFPIPLVPDYTTRYIELDIKSDQSTKLLQKLKTEHYSTRSFFTALGLAGMYEIITAKDSSVDALQLWTTHEMNLYQFCKKNTCKFGCYCTYLETPVDTKRIESSEAFWNLVQHCQMTVEPEMSSDQQLKMIKFFQKNLGGSPYGFFKSLGVTNFIRNDFGVAIYENMDLNVEYDGINVDSIIPMTSAHSMGLPFKLVVSIHGGKIHYSLSYAGNLASRDQAIEYSNQTLKFLQLALKNV